MKKCETCALATWQLTPTGRIKRNTPGICSAPDPTHAIDAITPKCFVFRISRVKVWPDNGADCPTWELK